MWSGCRYIVFLLTLSVLSTQALAEKRIALIIGMSDYAHAGRLRNPTNDASDIAEILKKFGFDVTLGLNLTTKDLDKTVDQFAYKLKGADAALFYYAGHGLQYREENFLVPIDASLDTEASIRRETLSVSYVLETMEELSPLNLVFLDACRDNPLAEKLKRSARTTGRSISLGRGLARMKTQKGDSLVVFATAPGEIAKDGEEKNSPFTTALLTHIKVPNLEIEVMMKRVIRDVRDKTSGQQSPETLSRLSREFVFNRTKAPTKPSQPSAAAPSTPDSEAARVWNDVKETASVAILETFVKRFPGTIYAEFARARAKELASQVAAIPAKKQPATLTAPPVFNPHANPSFSCKVYARIPFGNPERLPNTDVICMDLDLADADRHMGTLYVTAIKRLTRRNRIALKSEQKAWIARRDRNCRATWPDLRNDTRRKEIAICMERETRARFDRLAQWMDRIRR